MLQSEPFSKLKPAFRKVLGINWDIDSDLFVFVFTEIAREGMNLEFTIRNILKISAMFFDPLGLVCPVVLRAKLLFKRLCERKVGWDEVVPKDIYCEWKRYLEDLLLLRSYVPTRHEGGW